MAWRLINWAASFALALVVLATLAGAYLFYRAMPAYSGAERLPGLSAEVRVWRDAHGVAAHLRRLDGRCGARARLPACERADVPDGHSAPGRSGTHGRNPGRRSSGRRQVHSHPRLLPRGRERAFPRCRRGRRSASRLTPRASTPFSRATRSRPSSFSPAIAPSRGSRPTRWSSGRSRPISCPGTTRSSSCAPASLASLDRNRKVGSFRARGLAIPSRPCRRKATLTRAARASMKSSAP